MNSKAMSLKGRIKKYAAFKDKDLHRLAAYAEKFRVSKILKQYMEVLL